MISTDNGWWWKSGPWIPPNPPPPPPPPFWHRLLKNVYRLNGHRIKALPPLRVFERWPPFSWSDGRLHSHAGVFFPFFLYNKKQQRPPPKGVVVVVDPFRFSLFLHKRVSQSAIGTDRWVTLIRIRLDVRRLNDDHVIVCFDWWT